MHLYGSLNIHTQYIVALDKNNFIVLYYSVNNEKYLYIWIILEQICNICDKRFSEGPGKAEAAVWVQIKYNLRINIL